MKASISALPSECLQQILSYILDQSCAVKEMAVNVCELFQMLIAAAKSTNGDAFVGAHRDLEDLISGVDICPLHQSIDTLREFSAQQ